MIVMAAEAKYHKNFYSLYTAKKSEMTKVNRKQQRIAPRFQAAGGRTKTRTGSGSGV